MNRNTALVRAFLFIRKNRFVKKSNVYKTAIRLMVDLTIAIYLLVIVGYAFASLFIMGDVIEANQRYFVFVEEQAILRYWIVVAILPMRYIVRSFRDPGVIFSSSEDQLSILPFSKEKVWMLCVIEKWTRNFITYLVIGVIVAAFTPISGSIVSAYIALFMVMDIIMTIPQWKLFQNTIMRKVLWICGIGIINIIAVFTSYFFVSLLVVTLIIGVNLKLFDSIFHPVHWGRVMEVSDFKIWNMPIISKASETKFKRQRKYGVFKNSVVQRKPFSYTRKAIYTRIWRVYLVKNIDLVLKTVGMLFALLVVVLTSADVAFPVAIAIAIFIYASVTGILFTDRFQSDILHVLPWDLQSYKRSYLKWIVYGGIPLLIPIIIYFVLHGSIWAPAQLLLFVSTFLFVCQTKVDKNLALLSKQSGFNSNTGLSYLFLMLTALSGFYPFMSLSSIFVVVWLLNSQIKKVSP